MPSGARAARVRQPGGEFAQALEIEIVDEPADALSDRCLGDGAALQIAGERLDLADIAERLTVELASRGKDRPPTELPKIEGRVTGN